MRAANQTKNRPEQLLIKEVLEYHLHGSFRIETEKIITYPHESHEIRKAVIDIFVVYSQNHEKPREYLIRVQGPSHAIDDPVDQLQKSYLLAFGTANARQVIDLWYYKMPHTWKAKKKLKEEDLRKAFYEIYNELSNYFKLSSNPSKNWLARSVFKR